MKFNLADHDGTVSAIGAVAPGEGLQFWHLHKLWCRKKSLRSRGLTFKSHARQLAVRARRRRRDSEKQPPRIASTGLSDDMHNEW